MQKISQIEYVLLIQKYPLPEPPPTPNHEIKFQTSHTQSNSFARSLMIVDYGSKYISLYLCRKLAKLNMSFLFKSIRFRSLPLLQITKLSSRRAIHNRTASRGP